MIKENKELCGLDLDVLLFPESIGFNNRTGEYNQEAYNKIKDIDPKWHEALQGLKDTSVKRDSIQISTRQMVLMHNKSCEILADNVRKFASNRDAVVGIETYLAQNVTYDYDSLKAEEGTKRNGLRMASKNGLALGTFGGANGAYNAIMFNMCVCEGYTRAMQYLLKLKGINSRNVSCISGKDTIGMADGKNETEHTHYKLPDDGYHSIICVEDEMCLYCDPCWDAARYQRGDKSLPYCLLNKEEISRTHTLSFAERRIANEHISVPRNVVTDSIASNSLFKQTRLQNVKQAGETIKSEGYKGQITSEKDGR